MPAKRKTSPPAAQTALDYSKESEAQTRQRIDADLRQAGWEADTANLTFSKGARPQPGRNLAIAEWPTASGPADYAFFVGLTPLPENHL
jgi:type I restriction enzyme R subunit